MALEFDAARALILSHAKVLESEKVALGHSVGRVLAESIIAPWALPGADNSAMDGYAIAFKQNTDRTDYQVIGFLAAGQSNEGLSVGEGQAIKIMTGAVMPAGADTVVPSERVESLTEDSIRVRTPVRPGDNVRVAGEDVVEGTVVLPTGSTLRPAEISLLASFGITEPLVVRRPVVAILSTGDELIEPGQRPGIGQVVNSNSLALEAAIRALGAEPRQLGIAKDLRQDTGALIGEGLKADVLLTTAGISVGDRDYVQDALNDSGVQVHFSGLRIKPGRPTTFGSRGHTLIFSLPGNPVSTLLTFEEFVRPALQAMMGYQNAVDTVLKAKLAEPVRKKPGNLHLLRVLVEKRGDVYQARSAGDQNTGILTTMIRANGIALLDADREYFDAGEEVLVDRIGPITDIADE